MNYEIENIISACKLLMFRPLHNLYGNMNADRRQSAFSALMGRKMPKAQSGMTALLAALYEASGIGGVVECQAVRDELIFQWVAIVGSQKRIPERVTGMFGAWERVGGMWTRG